MPRNFFVTGRSFTSKCRLKVDGPDEPVFLVVKKHVKIDVLVVRKKSAPIYSISYSLYDIDYMICSEFPNITVDEVGANTESRLHAYVCIFIQTWFTIERK